MRSKYLKFVSGIVLAISISNVFAGQAQADALLARINHELDMIKPLINQAQLEAPKNQRVEFHYDWLRADINHMQAGINEELNQTNLAPRAIIPITGDYQDAPVLDTRVKTNG